MPSTTTLLTEASSDTTACWIVILVVVVGGIIAAVVKEAEKRKAREAYRRQLAQLRSDPTSSSVREETLRLGRTYSDLTRNRKGVTLFDEVAIMNDINAACAGAAKLERAPNTPADSARKESIEQRLARLEALRQQNLITSEEYHERRQRLLDEI